VANFQILFIYLSTFECSPLISFIEDKNGQKSHFVEKKTFHPKKRDGHPELERMEIIDLPLIYNPFLQDVITKNRHQFLK